jgi:hypothetical protein
MIGSGFFSPLGGVVLLGRRGWLLLAMLLVLFLSTSGLYSATQPTSPFASTMAPATTEEAAPSQSLEHLLFSQIRPLRIASSLVADDEEPPVSYGLLWQWGWLFAIALVAGRLIHWPPVLYFLLDGFRRLAHFTARQWHPRHLQFRFSHADFC